MASIMSGFSEIESALFRQVTDDQLQAIHHASLEILERTGVRLHLQEAVDLLKKGRCSRFRWQPCQDTLLFGGKSLEYSSEAGRPLRPGGE